MSNNRHAKKKRKSNAKNINGGKKPIVEHHIIPKSRFKEKGGIKGIKVKICSIFETAFHDLFWNMTIPEIIVFLIIIMYVRRDLKWSKNKLQRLRMLILAGHFDRQTSVMEKIFNIDSEFLTEHFRDKSSYCKNLPQ